MINKVDNNETKKIILKDIELRSQNKDNNNNNNKDFLYEKQTP